MNPSIRRFRRLSFVCLALAALAGPPAARSSDGASPGAAEPAAQEDHALWLGRQVLAITAAVRDPGMPDAMAGILALGRDSRYYVMVRGWLQMQLQGDLSILEAGGGTANPRIAGRIAFLREAIRAIDLE